MSTNTLDTFANKVNTLLHHKTTLIIMTLAVAVCTSTFAASHGLEYNWQYGALFFIALLALTFHFSKFFPKGMVSFMRVYAIVGLIAATIFVGISAWLSSATQKADNQLKTVNEKIAMLKDSVADHQKNIFFLQATKNPIRADQALAEKTKAEQQLKEQLDIKQKLVAGTRSYEVGNMAIFGHLQAFTGWSQKTVDLIFMWFVVSVFTAMELTMGYDLHRKK